MVLDSSVLVKPILKPGHWLPNEIYKRKPETHRKARVLIKTLKLHQAIVLIPYPVLVEVAAVVARLASRELAEKAIESLKATKNYIIIC
ncbi:MAG: hypothetical protein F7B11_03620 [Caldisphaeraceae archaeon]|nr:hypothetical protein [Caldisphaeraceae archaeon]